MYHHLQVEAAGVRLPLRSAQVRDMSGVCAYMDTRAENGLTALHLAALSGTLPCVQLLLEAGASMMVGLRGPLRNILRAVENLFLKTLGGNCRKTDLERTLEMSTTTWSTS